MRNPFPNLLRNKRSQNGKMKKKSSPQPSPKERETRLENVRGKLNGLICNIW